MRVLLIDQEVSAAQAIKAGLARASVVCDVAEYEAEELVELAASGYDAIVASVPNARLDVAQFISTLRHRRIGLPVVVLQGFRNSAESSCKPARTCLVLCTRPALISAKPRAIAASSSASWCARHFSSLSSNRRPARTTSLALL